MHLGKNLIHLCRSEGSNCIRVNISCRSNVQEQGRGRPSSGASKMIGADRREIPSKRRQATIWMISSMVSIHE